MDQLVIANLKKLYTKALFRKCFHVTNDIQLTLREFWKDHLNILTCINLIDNAWSQVSNRTMNLAWRKLWPGCGQERDFQGFKTDAADVEENAIVKEIVSLGKSMGLEVDREDVGDLVQDHSTSLPPKSSHTFKMSNKKSLLKMRKKLNRVSQVLQSKKFVVNVMMCKYL